MLVVSRRVGESIELSCEQVIANGTGGTGGTDSTAINLESIEITILEISKEKVRLGVKAPQQVKIVRSELLLAQSANVEASKSISKEVLDAFLNLNKSK